MPASSQPSVEHLTLANGLRVVLCHTPRLKRAAASLRVAAGSHDVPLAWPGLAHFLEHLFFLGTERFADDEKLMTFVQRNGGQLNASTRERTTDFFFELPTALFGQGLERLCEMLAHPRMTLADQLREREVLHAEFIAWSRDAQARRQIQALSPIAAAHPLRAFHAGNRYSLPVRRQAFQQALQDFYQRFYQAGQMTLCLTGPQSLDELRALANANGGYFASGEPVPQLSPPALMNPGAPVQSVTESSRKNLIFACEDLPEAADEAVAFLLHYLIAAQPGGLVAHLRERGLPEVLKAEVIYQFSGQLLINIEVSGAEQSALLHDWLAFFKAHWPAVSNDYNRLQQRRLATCSALDLAHRYARRTPTGLSKQGEKALTALLDQLATSTETAGDKIDWQLPTTNPFLASMDDGDNVEGAIYLRWHLKSPQPSLWQMFDQSLRTLADDARQAGVNLAFSAYGDYWQLRLVGLDAPMPAILQQALQLLRSPGDAALARYGQTIPEPAAIPIRQLLRCLPDQYLNSVVSQQSRDAQSVWAAAHWISFTTGVSEQRRQSLNSVLQQAPGTADQQALRLSPMNPGKHWQTEPSDSSESAILLFCPTPTLSAPDEAAWRLLAHLAQSPFYQRLRVELQLGYAVFSGFRQIAGQGGLLFGVQSPSASVRQLMRHLTDFIEAMPKLIDATDLQTQQKILAAQLDSADMESPTEAEMLWQAHLAGHGADYATQLHKAIISLGQPELHAAADQLEKATAGWLILSNASCGTP